MERSETLNRLIAGKPGERFPAAFTASAPKNAEDLIAWCLERDPTKRPSAQEVLKVSKYSACGDAIIRRGTNSFLPLSS